ncbi:site-specific integrase [Chitinophaga sp. 212800010-3]|uniref:site-specific integrase n=1 Tax=unclassified Chitinophaga TaxID=2619133 RepID=UPI002DEB92C5|nr:Tyr recombinase domain-containing protein [Chitinophaga sp. 212800010-3]
MNILERLSRKGDKITFYYDYGRKKGQRPSTGIFIYTNPKSREEKIHNKQARALIDVKRSEKTIEQQAIGSAYIPPHKFKANFLDYYDEYVERNKRDGNRHLSNSFTQFKQFLTKDFISPIEVTENLCKEFRRYLMDKYTGETPSGYFTRFKWVLDAATSDGYYVKSPSEDVAAKSNPSTKLKEHLEVEEYLLLLITPCLNQEVQEAFILSCYTGLRWCDVKTLSWDQIKGATLVTRIIQAKTGQPVTLTLHPIARAILEKRKKMLGSQDTGNSLVFRLPSADGANKILLQWVSAAGINKHITWSCARLSFSILLQDKLVDDATVAYLLGHTTTDQVKKTYKRHRPKDQTVTIDNLPCPELLPYFLQL